MRTSQMLCLLKETYSCRMDPFSGLAIIRVGLHEAGLFKSGWLSQSLNSLGTVEVSRIKDRFSRCHRAGHIDTGAVYS
jgi:hypothetical protein